MSPVTRLRRFARAAAAFAATAAGRTAGATLLPLLLLLLAGTFGGPFVLLALLALTLLVAVLDQLLPEHPGPATDAGGAALADRLLVALAAAHFLLLAFTLWTVAGGSGLALVERAGFLFAAGLWFGQVAHPVAHELIHRRARRLFRLGAAIYVSFLYGHHVSAHRHVHHRFVATEDDPSTALAGEGFYDYALRAWPGAFRAGHEMEMALAARRGRPGYGPYAVYLGGAAAFLLAAALVFGWGGLLGYLLLCLHVQWQILLSDYVQHYGLLRARLPDGRPEPVGAKHSWDAPAAFSGAMMLNAARHGEHHAHPLRPWAALRRAEEGAAPLLPYPLPVMAVIALFPPWWFRVMKAPLARWGPPRRRFRAAPARAAAA